MGFKWEKARKDEQHAKFNTIVKRGEKTKKLHKYLQIAKDREKLLKTKGWQICPSCGGGRHPAYATCFKCKLDLAKAPLTGRPSRGGQRNT